MTKKHYRSLSLENGQTAIELAVFGAIFFFIIGAIVQQSLSFGHLQNQNLRALRLALKQSYQQSEGLAGYVNNNDGNATRNSASVLFIEDRLTADSDKYGAFTRVPQVVSGAGSHSRNLFMPTEPGSEWNMPIVDVFVNGRHFPMTVAGLRTIEFDANNPDWNPDCASKIANPNQRVGCMNFYSVIPNHQAESKWCDGIQIPCPTDNLTDDERFDYNRDGINDAQDPLGAERAYMAWQWYLGNGYDETQPGAGANAIKLSRGQGVNPINGKNMVVDVDGDFKEERVMRVLQTNAYGVITKAEVMDFQAGDLDFSINSSDGKPRAGFTNDMQMYAFVKDTTAPGGGTYLQIEEGRLLTPDRQVVRSVQKKDKIDIVQRVMQLSNNTNRFCRVEVDGVPQDPPVRRVSVPFEGMPNPVEVCCGENSCSNGLSNCFDGDNVTKVCMDTTFNETIFPPRYPRIFVRSRILDQGGRKWITDITDDDYVDLGTE